MLSAAQIDERQAVAAYLESRSESDFERVFEALNGKLQVYYLARGVEPSTAEDLAQDVLITVFRSVSSLRDRDQFFGWLFRIAHREYLQWLRNRKHDPGVAQFEAGMAEPAEVPVADSLAAEDQFLKWMNILEKLERHIMMLRYLEELGYQEIATALNIPIGTVKWKISSAREKIAAARSRQKRRA